MQRTADAVSDVRPDGRTRATAGDRGHGTDKCECGDTCAKLAIPMRRQRWSLAWLHLPRLRGMDGVVASPQEVAKIRAVVTKPEFVVVTPGVRPGGSKLFDQKRVTTPREAILAGADYIVVGRPILEAPDPAMAARQILDEIEMSAANGATI